MLLKIMEAYKFTLPNFLANAWREDMTVGWEENIPKIWVMAANHSHTWVIWKDSVAPFSILSLQCQILSVKVSGYNYTSTEADDTEKKEKM